MNNSTDTTNQPRICFVVGDDFLGKKFQIEGGNYEMQQQKILFGEVFPKYPHAVFVDIGAMAGIYTVSAALLGRKVFAFEPLENTLKSLYHSVAINGLQESVSIFPYALKEKTYCVYSNFFLTPKNVVAAKLEPDQNCSKNENIRVTTLDNLLPTFQKLGIKQASETKKSSRKLS